MSKNKSDTENVVGKALGPLATGFGENSKEAGEILGKVAIDLSKTARAILLPIRGLVWGIEKFQEEFIPLLAERVSKIPIEKRIEPNLDIVGPSIETLKYHGYKEDIRELLANLIANSMNKDFLKYNHPSFVSIINQLSSDEAKILKSLSKNLYLSWEIISPREISSGLKISINATDLTYNGYEYFLKSIGITHTDLFDSYLDNLDRLQLMKREKNKNWVNKDITSPPNPEADKAIEKLLNHEKSFKDEIERWSNKEGREYIHETKEYNKGGFKLLSRRRTAYVPTEFGKRFIIACFRYG